MKLKITILLYLTIIIGNSLHAMEPIEPTSPFRQIPDELKLHIMSFLSSGQSLPEIVKNIRNLQKVNKEFYDLVNDEQFTNWLISQLAHKFRYLIDELEQQDSENPFWAKKEEVSFILAAASLNTPKSIEWLKKYLDQHEPRIEAAEQLLVQFSWDVAMVDGFIKADVNPDTHSNRNTKNVPRGTSALSSAAIQGSLASVRRLLSAGADPNSKTNDLPLAEAIWANRSDIVDTLLQAKADPNRRTLGGNTPLIIAAKRKEIDPKIVILLIAAGADINATHDQKTALDLAIFYKNHKLISILKEHGALYSEEPEEPNDV